MFFISSPRTDILRYSEPRTPCTSSFEVGFELGNPLLLGRFDLFIGIECRRVSGDMYSVGSVEVGGAEGNGGGVAYADM